MNKRKSTQEHINKITEFRQAVRANGFGKQRDAQSKTDAIFLALDNLLAF